MGLTAILVDDEPVVLDSINLGVNWNALGVTVCQSFTDSAQAFEYVKKMPVDIVITDVNMPPFSGLMLCSRIMQISPRTQFIIISGYADFSYAQKSMQFGAVGYCLKPIDYDELAGCIKKAIAKLVPKDKSFKQEFIEYLYENNVDQLKAYLLENNINESFYIGVSIGKQDLSKIFDGFSCVLGLNEYLYISNRALFPIITQEMLNDPDILGFGLAKKPIDAGNLHDCVYQTLYDGYQFFFDNTKKLFCSQAEYQVEFLDQARQLLCRPEELEKLLSDVPINHIHIAADLYAAVLSHVGNESAPYSYNQLIYLYKSFDSMKKDILNILKPSLEIQSEYESSNKKFLEMLSFINKNYVQDISILVIAEKLNLNMSYVSQLFKKETGTTFVKYLTKVRINHAKKLLSETELPVNEISEACGFHDYFYFIKQFKKYTDQTPTYFRKNENEVIDK